jgi:hypothetical protein
VACLRVKKNILGVKGRVLQRHIRDGYMMMGYDGSKEELLVGGVK